MRKLLTKDEERALLARAQAGEMVARNDLLVYHEALIWAEARRRSTYAGSLELEDLFSEGCIGFLRAIELFDPTRGTKFTTYAVLWVKQTIGRAIDNEARMIRLPIHAMSALRRHWVGSGGAPDPEGQAEAVGIAADVLAPVLSLDEPVGDGEDTLGEACCSSGEFEEEVLRSLYVGALLARLPVRLRRIVELRFGIGDGEEHTLAEVAQMTGGKSPQNVRRWEKEALSKLRLMLQEK